MLAYWSRVLLASGHHRQSVEKFNLAFAIFDSVEAPPQLTDRVQAEIFRFVALSNRPTSVSPQLSLGSNLFRKEGDFWTISFEGSVLPAARHGRECITSSRLVANPGTEFSAQDLAASAHKANLKHHAERNRIRSTSNGRANGDRD